MRLVVLQSLSADPKSGDGKSARKSKECLVLKYTLSHLILGVVRGEWSNHNGSFQRRNFLNRHLLIISRVARPRRRTMLARSDLRLSLVIHNICCMNESSSRCGYRAKFNLFDNSLGGIDKFLQILLEVFSRVIHHYFQLFQRTTSPQTLNIQRQKSMKSLGGNHWSHRGG
jgi:hypothetical protein